MAASTDLARVLYQFVARYRRAVVAKVVVLSLLTVLLVGLMASRLREWDVAPAWRLGLPVALGAGAALALGWWLRRAWLSTARSAAELDRRLRLELRLVTAMEFASANEPPALYPLLVEDAAKRFAPGGLRVPKPLDRTAGTLALMVLLLLLLPRLEAVKQQFAQRPTTQPHVPQPQPQPEPTAQPSQPQDKRRESTGAPGSSSREQRESRGQGESREPDESRGAQQQAGSQDAREASGREQRAGQSGSQSGQQQASGNQQQAGGGQQQSNAGQQQSGAGQDQAGAQGAQAQGAASQQTAQRAASAQPGTGEAGTGAGQEALRAEIQQLLREVSGELKELQQQLAETKDQPPPQPGTGTDPELYESPMPIEPHAGAQVPIHLSTDAGETAMKRPAGGVGEPAKAATMAQPTMQPEEASLAEQPIEERSASREAIPPEYRDVFQRLNR